MKNNYFADRFHKIRKSSSYTQKQIGEYLGISNRAVSNWENGISYPSTDNLIRLSKLFNVRPDYFYSDGMLGYIDGRYQPVDMESLRELYRIGRGPSSSHTIGPERACIYFAKKNHFADSFSAVLFGSLARTGKGHGTDVVIKKTLAPKPCEVQFDFGETDLSHPNTFILKAYKNKVLVDQVTVYSIGGGRILIDGQDIFRAKSSYSLHTFSEIANYCKENNLRLWQYAEQNEDANFRDYMFTVWAQMKRSIQNGLNDEGILPGGLGVHKKAKQLISLEHIDETPETRENRLVSAYAFAVGEQNAAGETIITAPTCGAAGVVPAVLFYQQQKRGYSDDQIVNALETAGVIGNLIKTNGSISGAECGCQAEIGSACAMAAASLGELFGLSFDKIEYAAEISIEHHLGLTCDPICGLVQIPCIERNAVAAMRAINAVNIASFLSDTRKISFDNIVGVMKKTGLDISNRYKETAEGGLATIEVAK